MFMIDYKQGIWWYWPALACALTAGISGYTIGFELAIFISAVQLIHFVIREQSITSFPIQVRFWFLVYVAVSYPEPLQVLYWLPVVGTWARGIFGYCILARTLSLMPWNRHVPFSTELLIRAFFSRPVRGSILSDSLPRRKTAGYA
jgi:hypothetical protein